MRLALAAEALLIAAPAHAQQESADRSQHELVSVFKRGESPHQNNVELGRHGRNRTNVWAYAGANTVRSDDN